MDILTITASYVLFATRWLFCNSMLL